MVPARSDDPSRDSPGRANRDLLVALVQGIELDAAVPRALELVSRDPLESAGQFPGDVLRALMEVSGDYWTRHPRQYEHYRNALRAGAELRRRMPPDHRFDFWTPLGIPNRRE